MDDTELLNLFWSEVREYIQALNNGVLSLETSGLEDAGDFVETLRELNRIAHSMKGAARAVGEDEVEQLGHHVESVFDAALRSGLALTPDVCDLLYDAIDLVQRLADGESNDPGLVLLVLGRLNETVQNGKAPPGMVAEETESVRVEKAFDRTQLIPSPFLGDAQATREIDILPGSRTPDLHTVSPSLRPEDSVRVSVAKIDRLMAQSSELLVAQLQSEEQRREIDALRRLQHGWNREWQTARSAYIRLARRFQGANPPEELLTIFKFLEENQRHLVEAARHLAHLSNTMARDSMRSSTLADDLQSSVAALRLVPFDSIESSLNRILRDAARQTGKSVQLDVVGATVEIDKTVLDNLKDPLMHLIRNAVDHGIESPEDRIAAGKSETGWVYINVETRGSEIVLGVSDDGRGIDADGVRRAAVQFGVISQSAADSLTDEEARTLIFHPDVTTRDEVTSLSGRGVGMDVVRDRVESLRGRVSLASVLGQGTTILLNVPVSLTRLRVITLQLGNERYALPSLSVVRMATVNQSAVFTAEGRAMVRVNNRAMTLVSLGEVLNVPIDPQRNERMMRLVVVRAADRTVALEVDTFVDERELVLKRLGPELADLPFIGGAALLGNGEVILVLDVNDLVRNARRSGASRQTRELLEVDAAEASPRTVLIVDDSITTRTLEKNILETAGYRVTVAIDGVEAWELLSETAFDVIVSDVEMPRMDGLSLTRRVKDSSSTSNIPVVLLTSLNSPEQREAGLKAGADAYLVKSRFNQEDLLRTIRSVL